MSSPRRRTSFEVDLAKLDAAKAILGTATLTDTVDAALTEVIRAHGRQRLVEMLFADGALELNDADVMHGAWRRPVGQP